MEVEMTEDIPRPPDFTLLPGERLVSVVHHKPRRSIVPASSLREILRLTRAKSPDDIGKSGPSLAAVSLVTQDETHEVPDHLKLYEAVFGRDSLRVAIDLISTYPELARSTTLELARLQGVEFNTAREEEPGRIVHEARESTDLIAQSLSKERGWDWPYYGSVDATPEFIRTLTAYCQVTEENRQFLSEEYIDRAGETRTMSYALEMAVSWILRRLDSNPEGILEYHSVLPKGIENQVWKDSWDAYHHSDGSLANHEKGIASIEVQVTTYDALIDAAELYEDVFDQPERAKRLRERAEKLRQTIFNVFWTNEKEGYFVLGTDRDENDKLRPLKVRTSNMGHTLNSRLLKGSEAYVVDMRERIVAQMSSPELLTPQGIRTLASDEVRFREGAYHCGSIWLWDTHHIAKGLRRLKYIDQADKLDARLLHIVEMTGMFPEYVRGNNTSEVKLNVDTITTYDELNQRENKVEQPPQEVQGWTVAAILATKRRVGRIQK
jgi:glycogen debranching enzyme